MSEIICKSCGKHMKWPYQGHTICYACYHKDVEKGKIALDTFGPIFYKDTSCHQHSNSDGS